MKPMTKRERLTAAIAGQQVDRPPVALWRHFPMDDRHSDQLAESQLLFQRLYDWDVMKVSPTSSFQVEDWGVTDFFTGDPEGSYDQNQFPVQSPQDWAQLPLLNAGSGALGRQVRCLEILGEALRGEPDQVPFIQTVFSPLSQAKKLASLDRMLVAMRSEPRSLKAGLETITRSTIAFIEAAKRTGMAGIYYAVQFASYLNMSEDEYREFGEPYDRRVLESLDGTWLNMMHIHGLDPMFDLLSEYPVQAINWHDQESLPSLAQAQVRTDKLLVGGLDQKTVMCGSIADVQAKSAAALAQTGGKQFMLGVGCVTMVSSPWGNLRAARRAAEARP